MSKLLKTALKLAEKGQPVFPTRGPKGGEHGKAPIGSLVPHGLTDATTDPELIERWWGQHPGAGIGTPTGIKWDVLDVDVKEDVDGRIHIPTLQQLGLLDGCRHVVRTPSGGWHLYFKSAGVMKNKNHRELGLDVRGAGGYVVAPPSKMFNGAYEKVGKTEGGTKDPLLWSMIVACLMPMDVEQKTPVQLLPSERRASIGALREWVSVRQPGERNHGLFWAVCRCIENGIDPHELLEAAVLSGLPEEEALVTIRAALKRVGLEEGDLDTEAGAMFPDLPDPS